MAASSAWSRYRSLLVSSLENIQPMESLQLATRLLSSTANTQRQTNKHRLFSGGQLHKWKKSRQHAQKHLLFPMQITAFIILLMPSSAASFNVKKKKKFCIWKWHYNVLFSGFTTPVDAWNFLTVPWGINILQRYVTLSIQDSFRQMVASGTNRTIWFSCCTSFYYFNYSDWLIRLLITNPWTRK